MKRTTKQLQTMQGRTGNASTRDDAKTPIVGTRDSAAVVAVQLVVLLTGCGLRDSGQPATTPGPGPAPSAHAQVFACQEQIEYGYRDQSPLGISAHQAVQQYGSERTAPLAGASASLAALGVTSDARPTLSISFEYAGDAVKYSGDCGSHRLMIPVLLTATLSTGQVWRSAAMLKMQQHLPTTVRLEPTAEAPFYLTARLMPGDTDVQLEPLGEIKPLRFTTLCGSSVDASTKKHFNSDLAALIKLSQPPRLSCVAADGSGSGTAVPPFTVTLADYDEHACHPHPAMPAEFHIALNLAADWSEDVLRGSATVGRDGDVSVVRYKVSGTARGGAELARLRPCAADDDNVSVMLEGGIRSTNPPEREPATLTFFLSCEDIAIRCTTQ